MQASGETRWHRTLVDAKQFSSAHAEGDNANAQHELQHDSVGFGLMSQPNDDANAAAPPPASAIQISSCNLQRSNLRL
jgi:hypothetical protein